jgi:hypothetical protein
MSDTAPDEFEPIPEPELDLDAMLADLHSNFPNPDSTPDATTGDDTEYEESTTEGEDVPPAEPSPSAGPLDSILPPNMVEFAGEIMPIEEAQALIELNRQVKSDPAKAARVRDAIIGTTSASTEFPTSDLPEWMDPDDQQTVFLFRQQQRIESELAEVKAAELRRQQEHALQQQEVRKQQVITSFRSAVDKFTSEHPEFDHGDIKVLVDQAAAMRLLDNPESLDPEGSLVGGMIRALDTAMWAMPEYRKKVVEGDNLRSKAQEAEDRKKKSSALSSSTGSTPRTTTQESRPTNRQQILQNMMQDLRSGLTD